MGAIAGSTILRIVIISIALASIATAWPLNRAGLIVFSVSNSQIGNQSSQTPNSAVSDLSAQLNSSDEEKRRDAALQIAALNTPEAIQALASLLNDPSERIRALAVTELAQKGDASLIPAIAARLSQDKKPFVRKAAAYALGALHNNEATVALTAALKDKDKEVRGAAAVALGEYQDGSAIAPLKLALSDRSEFVRAQAARALGANGRAATEAVSLLINLLTSDKEQEVKRQAAIALGLIGDRSALPALERAERDPDPYLSQAAAEAIKKITPAS